MTEYEKALDEAVKNNIDVIEKYPFKSKRIGGLYCDGSVALSKELKTEAEKNSVLQEELGHFFTSSGNILDMQDTISRKQEMKARIWAYNNAIGLHGIISAYKKGCHNRYEIADYLNVSEQFFEECLKQYTAKYGLCTQIDNYVIYFEPLGVLELYR